MNKVQILRSLVNHRLTAAAEEIFELFERTIAEYEEEIRRKQRLLDAVLKPEVQSHRADVHHSMVKGDVLPELQESNWSLNQENPAEPAHVKEEQGEVWINQERKQLQEPEENDIKSMFTSGPAKSEDDEEKPQSFQLDGNQREENRDTEHLKTGPIVQSEPDRDLDPHSHSQPVNSVETSHLSGSDTDDSGDWEEGDEPPEGSKSLKNKSETKIGTSVSSSESVSSTGQNNKEQKKLFSCSICGNNYLSPRSLSVHMLRHSKEHRFNCSVCKKGFPWKGELKVHMRLHTGEKPFSCPVCGKGFSDMSNLTSHFKSHKGAQMFPCSTCKKSFVDRQALLDHTRTHTERLRSCSFCGKTFASNVDLERHVRVHTREKPYSCSVCGKSFAIKHHVKIHSTVHTGEKRFSCSLCGKKFAQDEGLRRHSVVHTREKPFSCDICDRRFTQLQSVKKHKMAVHKSTPNSKQ